MKSLWHNPLITVLLALSVLTACATAAEDGKPDGPKPPPVDKPETKPDNRPDKKPEDKQEAPTDPPVADPRIVELLDRIEAASDKLNTLKARVRYTRLQTTTGDQQRRFGDFYYTAGQDKKPTRFAILFDRLLVDGRARPMQRWFIFDGNWLLERDHKDKTATRRELVPKGAERSDVLNMGEGQLPIPLRLKTEKVLKSYTVKRLKDEKASKDLVLVHLKLTPRKKGAEPLSLWFNSKTLLLYRVVTTDESDEIEILLPRPEPNKAIDTETFDTKLPSKTGGWQVQEVPLKKR